MKAIYDWTKIQLIYNIQIFLEFANFYQQFIQRFSKLTTPLTFILKITLTTGLTTSIRIRDKNIEQSGQEV